MREDRGLLWGLKRGDKDSLRKIYLKYKDLLLTVAFSLVHDSNQAEDILHDVFVAFARNSQKLELRGSLKNYLVTSVVNNVRDRYRRNKCHIVGIEEADPISSNTKDPQMLAILNEDTKLLADALNQLPLEQRETVILHLKGGLKFKDIARMYNLSMATVQARYRYGIKKLRVIFNGEKE